ncbi:MAG: hypothetical protein CFE34_08840 [Rhodobacteraceae bacterium PARR1]|nr:MAG: hypothetical protein CFE34_08840 [Rhodobacteraceae bacterium PARR1]
MKYLLLLYVDPAKEPAQNTPELGAYLGGFYAASQKMVADGALIAGEGLGPVETATSLRIRGGKVETMDGPFAETREHLGGFYLIDVPDLDAALAYAASLPTAPLGTVEVRPVMIYDDASGA